jgi:hypothetical protein
MTDKTTKHVRRKTVCETCRMKRKSRANVLRHADARGHKVGGSK